MDIKYGIVAVKKDFLTTESTGKYSIYHFCGYENPPTFESYVSLYKELGSDEEFGLIEMINDLVLVPATEDIINEFGSNFQEESECHPTLSEIYGNG